MKKIYMLILRLFTKEVEVAKDNIDTIEYRVIPNKDITN